MTRHPAHMHVPPRPPHTHAGDAREQRGTYIIIRHRRVGPVVEEAERHVAVTIAACPQQWGPATLLTRDTEGHTHVSTTPHTTHARAMQRGWGIVDGEGVQGVCAGVGGREEGDGPA